MATRFVFSPYAAEFPSTNFPELGQTNRRPYLGFDAATNENCIWTGIVPQGWTGTITAIVSYIMASATSGDVDIDVEVEAITDGDSVDLDVATSFDTANSTDNTTVPGTAGFIDQITVTLTNNDSSAAGDYIRFRLTRDAVSDTAAGDMRVLAMEIRDGA
jgi:hypothetical protein